MDITKEDFLDVIDHFLNSRLNEPTRLPKEERALEQLIEEGNEKEIEQQREKVINLKARFNRESWMEDAALRRVHWQSIATHISKGIHPDSRGDNVVYKKRGKRADGVVSSESIDELLLDSTGNAAALDIFAFFNLEVKSKKIMDWISEANPEIIKAFSSDEEKAKAYWQNFKASIEGTIERPITHERNKQLLWPNSIRAAIEDDYTLLVPLHPVSFCHQVYQKVRERNSDENRENRSNRNKVKAEKRPYFNMIDIGVVNLGGSNPQGVSQLTSSQGGRNYLLPNFAPQLDKTQEFKLKTSDRTLFNKNLRYACSFGIGELIAVVKLSANGEEIRERRKNALDEILSVVLMVAHYLQKTLPQDWSKGEEYQLNRYEKRWLDPLYYKELEEEKEGRITELDDWSLEVERNFANWLNLIIKRAVPEKAALIDDEEAREWKRCFEASSKASKRRGEGIYYG